MEERSTAGQRVLAVLAYVGPLVVIPLMMPGKNRFLRYHARQGMYLFGVFIACLILTMVLLFVFRDPVPQRLVFLFLSVLLLLEFILYGLLSLYLAFKAAKGTMPMLPVLGDVAGDG